VGMRYPPLDQAAHAVPLHWAFLTTSGQRSVPVTAHFVAKPSDGPGVAWDAVVLAVAAYYRSEPLAHPWDWVVWTGWAQIVCVPLFFVAMTLANLAWGPDSGYVLPGWALPSALLYYVLFASFAGGGYVLWTLGARVSTQAAAPTTQASRLGVPQPGA
jgi:hypothetical protein